MGRAAPRPCTAPGCRGLVDGASRTSRCVQHARPAWETNQGTTAHQRGYGARWRKLRALVLAEEPLCRECSKAGRIAAARIVDHIVPKAEGGGDERSNLQPLCLRCSNDKTQREAQRGRAKG